MKRKLTYKSTGVDISAGDRATLRIKNLAKSTFTPNVLKEIGSFGGFFSLRKNEHKSPVLVSSVDSVGTKLKVAFMMRKHDTVGEDLVNHCINDILVHGAKPLFFLDYIGTGKLFPDVIEQIVKGLSRACKKAGCALIGGETAELPEFYKKGEYDLAGCIVGVVEKKKIIDGLGIRPGDQIIGLKSSGLHTNGYSLARNVFFKRGRLGVNSYVKELKTTVGKELLKVHRCYAPSIFPLVERFKIKGIAHITGGGIEGNLKRILPANCGARILASSWRVPPVFKVIQGWGNIDNQEMFKVFNMGIGLILVVPKIETNRILNRLSLLKETAYRIGEVTSGKGEVKLLRL
ncbi:MAG: phosphoribosylaminoimidazole synthetase [candidate division Zixibacteria bacterium SM23_73_3]|nr:MAG: phosphoribosylaminoimidazole synthetase [candidate division Zixibacteria bacterium SM23_73_3]